MKVYICWDEYDYYGPDPVTDDKADTCVFASLESAKRFLETVKPDRPDRHAWKQAVDGRWHIGSLYIEETEVRE